MHYPDAIKTINQFQNPQLAAFRRGRPHIVSFISPAVSVALAAARLNDESIQTCQFSAECVGYASHTGLADAIAGKPLENRRGGQQGATYSRLTHLQSHHDVEFCNDDRRHDDNARASNRVVPHPWQHHSGGTRRYGPTPARGRSFQPPA